MPDLPGAVVVQGGAVGVLLLFVLLVLTGRIVGARQVDRQVTSAERREGEWRAALNASEQARQLQGQQLAELLELARTQHAVMQALLALARGDPT